MAKVKSYTEILLHINSQLNEQEVKNWLTLRKKDIPPGNLESFKHDILEFFRHMESRDIYTEKKYHSLLGDLENLGLISLKNEVEEMFCLLNSASLSQYSKIGRPSSLVGNTSVPSTASTVGYASGGGASMDTLSSTQSMHIKQCEENIQIIEQTGNMSLETIDELFPPNESLKDGITMSGRLSDDVEDITGDLSEMKLEYSDEPTIDARSRQQSLVSKDGSGHAGSVGIDRKYQPRIEVEPLHGRPPPVPERPQRRPEITELELCQLSMHFDAGVIDLFGLELGFSSGRISQLKSVNPYDLSNVFYRLMVEWRKAQHGDSNMRENLANHLRNIKCMELADDLEGGRFRR